MQNIFATDLQLRDVIEKDFPIFFEQQLDASALYMAAFTSKDPTDREAFIARWNKFMDDHTIQKKTILYNGHVIGNIINFEQFGQSMVGYWIGKEYWGKGLATKALILFLEQIKTRPLFARVAKDNIASIRVLQKCGFNIIGEDKGFSNARGVEVEEFILILNVHETE